MFKYKVISASILFFAVLSAGMWSPAEAPVSDAAGASPGQSVEAKSPEKEYSFEAPRYNSHNLDASDGYQANRYGAGGYDADRSAHKYQVPASEDSEKLKPRNI